MVGRLSGPLGLAALGAFLVADVALVGLAVRSTSAEPQSTDRPAADSGVSAAGAASPTTGATDSTPAASAPEPAPLRLGLVAVDDQTAWRFQTGTCADGGSTLAVTEDGGRTWQPRAAPFDVTVRVRVRDDGSAFAIGADGGCAPRFRQSKDQAAGWKPSTAVPGVWYRDPKDPAVVGTEAGRKAQPCDAAGVVDLAVGDDSARALCGDGRLLGSKTGTKWSADGSIDGALAIALDGDRLLALVAAPGCEGLAVVDAAAPQTALGCAPVNVAGVGAGQVALASKGGVVWVGAGSTVLRSSGDLATWAPQP